MSVARTKKSPAKKTTAKKSPAKKTTAKKTTAKKRVARSGAGAGSRVGAGRARVTVGRRADFGAPIEGFFAKQPAQLREVLEALRKLVLEAAPDATSSLKWGMPFFAIGETMICAIAGHKAHVNLILPGAPGTFADPDGLLTGEGKTGRHIKFRAVSDLPTATVRGWLKTAVANAREGALTGKRMR